MKKDGLESKQSFFIFSFIFPDFFTKHAWVPFAQAQRTRQYVEGTQNEHLIKLMGKLMRALSICVRNWCVSSECTERSEHTRKFTKFFIYFKEPKKAKKSKNLIGTNKKWPQSYNKIFLDKLKTKLSLKIRRSIRVRNFAPQNDPPPKKKKN